MSNRSIEQDLRERAAAVMPDGYGGQLSTRSLPDRFPQFFARADGCHIWGVDGTRYLDYMCAYGPNLFGYRNPEVERAAAAQAELGDVITLLGEDMVAVAEALVGMVAHADWAMFCKNGTDATTMALMVARGHTGKRKILAAKGAYHGAMPWCTPVGIGVLPEDRAHIVYYTYNDAQSLIDAANSVGDDLAGIIGSAFRHDSMLDEAPLDPEYARTCRRICDDRGALLIVDEIRAGLRLTRDCSWSLVDVLPDLSCWGKAIANGYALSVVLGADKAKATAGAMYATGTFWFGAVAMAAARATLELARTTEYLQQTIAYGEALRAGLDRRATDNGFALRQSGPAQMPQIMFEDDPDFKLAFAWTQEAVQRGVYFHPWHNMFVSTPMGPAELDQSLQVADQAFAALRKRRDHLTVHPFVTQRKQRMP